MSEDDLWDPNYRSLRDAIAFVSQRFTVREAESMLYDVLVSGDLTSILQRWTGERFVREWLTGWKEIEFSITSYADHPRELMRDSDIEIARGLQALDPNLILVWWPRVEELCEPTVAQAEPAAQSESIEPRAPITPPETAAPRGEQPPCEEKPVPAVSTLDRKPRIDWNDLWKYWTDRRAKGLLPPEKDFLDEATQLIKDRYHVKTVPESELRRLKAALYRGDSERPKRPGRKRL